MRGRQASLASTDVTRQAYRSRSPSRPHQHPNQRRPGPAAARTVRPTHVYARRVDWCSCTGSLRRTTVSDDWPRGRRLTIVIRVVDRRSIVVRARCAPPRRCFTAVGILARHSVIAGSAENWNITRLEGRDAAVLRHFRWARASATSLAFLRAALL